MLYQYIFHDTNEYTYRDESTSIKIRSNHIITNNISRLYAVATIRALTFEWTTGDNFIPTADFFHN